MKRENNYIILATFVVCVLVCYIVKVDYNARSRMIQNPVSKKDLPADKQILINEIIENHDEASLSELAERYWWNAMPYALYMADNLDNRHACAIVYELLSKFYDYHDKVMPQASFDMCYKLLEKGARLGSIKCMKYLEEIYEEGVYVPRDISKSHYYKSLLIETKKQELIKHRNNER